MKNTSLIFAAAIIVIANALAVAHAARNRAGRPDAEITLTNRELAFFNNPSDDDDSGITLDLRLTDPGGFFSRFAHVENPGNWLDRQKLQTLGFNCSVDPAGPDAVRFYQRQRPRQVFAALEYNGAAWRAWLENYEREIANQRAKAPFNDVSGYGRNSSRLVAIDADLNPVNLRIRHPDRANVAIVPAVVAVGLSPFPYPGMKPDPGHPVQVVGSIQEIPSAIHVPRPFSDGFRRPSRRQGGGSNGSYRVRLRYGSSFEPWVTGVEFTSEQ